jgi:hypothetical protein
VPADDEDEPKERLQISLAQVAASSGAAVSAAVLCSLFGVAGTVIGTAIASVLATVGSALYVHSLRRTKARLRRLHQAGAVSPPFSEVVKTARQQGHRVFGQIPWRFVGAGAGAAFVVALALVTIVELSAGKSLSALFGVSHSGGRTTSIEGVLGVGSHVKHKPKPKPTATHSGPASSNSPSPSPTVTVTKTVSPSPSSSSPSPTTSPTVTPTTTPTATPTGVAS